MGVKRAEKGGNRMGGVEVHSEFHNFGDLA